LTPASKVLCALDFGGVVFAPFFGLLAAASKLAFFTGRVLSPLPVLEKSNESSSGGLRRPAIRSVGPSGLILHYIIWLKCYEKSLVLTVTEH